jgi:hypothetical protein
MVIGSFQSNGFYPDSMDGVDRVGYGDGAFPAV